MINEKKAALEHLDKCDASYGQALAEKRVESIMFPDHATWSMDDGYIRGDKPITDLRHAALIPISKQEIDGAAYEITCMVYEYIKRHKEEKLDAIMQVVREVSK